MADPLTVRCDIPSDGFPEGHYRIAAAAAKEQLLNTAGGVVRISAQNVVGNIAINNALNMTHQLRQQVQNVHVLLLPQQAQQMMVVLLMVGAPPPVPDNTSRAAPLKRIAPAVERPEAGRLWREAMQQLGNPKKQQQQQQQQQQQLYHQPLPQLNAPALPRFVPASSTTPPTPTQTTAAAPLTLPPTTTTTTTDEAAAAEGEGGGGGGCFVSAPLVQLLRRVCISHSLRLETGVSRQVVMAAEGGGPVTELTLAAPSQDAQLQQILQQESVNPTSSSGAARIRDRDEDGENVTDGSGSACLSFPPPVRFDMTQDPPQRMVYYGVSEEFIAYPPPSFVPRGAQSK